METTKEGKAACDFILQRLASSHPKPVSKGTIDLDGRHLNKMVLEICFNHLSKLGAIIKVGKHSHIEYKFNPDHGRVFHSLDEYSAWKAEKDKDKALQMKDRWWARLDIKVGILVSILEMAGMLYSFAQLANNYCKSPSNEQLDNHDGGNGQSREHEVDSLGNKPQKFTE